MKYDIFRALDIVELTTNSLFRHTNIDRVKRATNFLYALFKKYNYAKADNEQMISMDASNTLYGAWATLNVIRVKLECKRI